MHRDVEVARWTSADAGVPAPCTRTRSPSAVPAGIGALTASARVSCPAPPQRSHDRGRCSPEPAHDVQLRVNTMCPRTVRTAPLPDTTDTRHRSSASRRCPRRRGRSPPRQRERPLRPFERLVERHVRVLMEIGSALGRRTAAATLAQYFREQVAERRRMVAPRAEKSNPSKPLFGRSSRASTWPGVVARSALRVHQRFVRVEDLPEPRLRHAVSRIDIRVKPAREAAIGPLISASVAPCANPRTMCRSMSLLFVLDHLCVDHISGRGVAGRLTASGCGPGLRPGPRRRAGLLVSDSAALCCACVNCSIARFIAAVSFEPTAVSSSPIALSTAALSAAESCRPCPGASSPRRRLPDRRGCGPRSPLAPLAVLLRVRLGVFHHPLDLVLAEAARRGDGDLLFLAGAGPSPTR